MKPPDPNLLEILRNRCGGMIEMELRKDGERWRRDESGPPTKRVVKQ